jgi:hypothetical protein
VSNMIKTAFFMAAYSISPDIKRGALGPSASAKQNQGVWSFAPRKHSPGRG